VDEVLAGEGAERQSPALAAGRLGREEVQALDGVEDPPRFGQELLAGGGQQRPSTARRRGDVQPQ
jgi:hypothetical protein